jgi:hypothetical protein
LVSSLTHRILSFLADPTFPAPSLSSSWLPSTAATDDKTKEMLNCLRVLSRIWPLIFEASDGDWAERLLWTRKPVSDNSDEAQFVIDDDEDPDASLVSNASFASTQTQRDLAPSLGQKLWV